MIDRTAEFHSAVKVFQRTTPDSDQTDFSVSSEGTRSKSKFWNAALAISLGFKGTEKLIVQLEKLVQRTGTHNDPTEEISEVASYFKKDLDDLTAEIKGLENIAAQSTARGSQRFRHYTFVVEVLKSLAQEHTKKFQTALEKRTLVMKEQNKRHKLYSHSKRPPRVNLDSPLFSIPPPSSQKSATSSQKSATSGGEGQRASNKGPTILKAASPPVSTGGFLPSSDAGASTGGGGGLRQRAPRGGGGASNAAAAAAAGGAGGGGGGGGGRAPNRMVQQVQMHALEGASAQRVAEARQVERMVAELGTMFSKMATLVAAQGEVVQRIDDDVELAHAGVEAGHLELQKFYSIVRGNRGLIIKIFAILCVFIFLFVVVFR